MKKLTRILLLLVASASAGALCLFFSVPAGLSEEASSLKNQRSESASAAKTSDSLDPRELNEIKSLLRRGAYEEVEERLKSFQEKSPGNLWVALYLDVCRKRLSAEKPFSQLSAEDFKALKKHLDEESRQQKRSAAIQKAVDRRIEKDQAAWSRRLEKEHKVWERQQRRREPAPGKQAQQPAPAAQAQAETQPEQPILPQAPAVPAAAATPAAAPTPAPSPTPAPTPEAQAPAENQPAPVAVPATERATREAENPQTAKPSAPEAEQVQPPAAATAQAPVSGVSGGTIELSPVTVKSVEVVSPSLAGQPAPIKGAVQIHARQMNVSPDRRIAIADRDVEVIFENAILTCDHLTLFTDTKDAYAEGNVRIEQGLQVFRGEMVHYNFVNKKGRFLQGTVSSPPWVEHGKSIEHIAEGVYEVTPGYLTTCELEPPHFKLAGQRSVLFADDRFARMKNVALIVEKLPVLYLPFASFEEKQSPFFIIPGKKKPWEQFVLMGYRYKLPIPGGHKGTVKLDWRRAFLWGMGLDHQFDSSSLGKGLFKGYYNDEPNIRRPKSDLPKGAKIRRYRALWRHRWNPMPDTTVVTDIQKYSDIDFRKELLFREEFTSDDTPESFVSVVTNDPNYTLTGLVKRRINRFQTVTNALPQLTFDVRPQRIGDTFLFSESKLDFANFETKRAHSDNDTDAVRLDWFEQLKYALNWFRPIEVTPKVGIRQTYYNKDRQGSDRKGDRHIVSGQWNAGVENSLKLFRFFPVNTNFLGLNIHALRHVLTPTVAYDFIHRPTVANDLLDFTAASGASNRVTLGIENKLQTRRPDTAGKLRGTDLGRLLISVPYTFRGNGNKQGGRLGDWSFDLETYPLPWMRLETDWTYQAVPPHDADTPSSRFNLDLVMVGGGKKPEAKYAPGIQAPVYQAFEGGPHPTATLMPKGQWYVGLGHRYSREDKTESVLEYDWQVTEKWQIGTFNRLTWKEVASGSKRFYNLREFQYRLRRDLHDWIAELVYRVDREFGEEIFFTLTLKAYPNLPISFQESYHQPKIGSQSSPFSPIRVGQ